MPIHQQTPHAPAGLQFAENYQFRFWVRPETASFENLYAVSIRHAPSGIEVKAFPVVGYIGDFVFDWAVPDNAMALVVAVVPQSRSLRLFKDLAQSYGSDWLLCNAGSEADAAASSDAAFVRSWVLSQERYRSLHGVYLASNGRGCVKIGKTDSCLLTRIRSLQLANPDELRVVAFIPTPNASEVEALLHQKHKAVRIRGEWFALSDEAAVETAVAFGGRAFD